MQVAGLGGFHMKNCNLCPLILNLLKTSIGRSESMYENDPRNLFCYLGIWTFMALKTCYIIYALSFTMCHLFNNFIFVVHITLMFFINDALKMKYLHSGIRVNNSKFKNL